ncbi:MAG: GYD domain-containing protein [Desulfuromonadales bacterium]
MKGGSDYLDVFRAPDIETAMKVSTIVRAFGHAHTEVWAATEWKRYKEMVRNLKGAG